MMVLRSLLSPLTISDIELRRCWIKLCYTIFLTTILDLGIDLLLAKVDLSRAQEQMVALLELKSKELLV